MFDAAADALGPSRPLSERYGLVVDYETWFHGNVRLVAADPTRPIDNANYRNITFVSDGPPVAHTVAVGASRPECGTDVQVLPHGFQWPDPIPD